MKTTRSLTLPALMTALLCILGPLTLPLGPVPVSLLTALLMLIALLAGPFRALLCGALYLLIGLLGLPVFSGFSGGVGQLIGPTGGFLLGYLPLAFSAGLGARKDQPLPTALGCIAGHALLYALGAAWYCRVAMQPLSAALAVCVWPFLPIDGMKIALVIPFGLRLKRRLRRASLLC